jgi:cyclopropane fatty-acyl-phospholipid synthase-like methyltransferase
MWDCYLASSEGGFRAGQIDVDSCVLAKPNEATLS